MAEALDFLVLVTLLQVVQMVQLQQIQEDNLIHMLLYTKLLKPSNFSPFS